VQLTARLLFLLTLRRTPASTLCPYTTLFRSEHDRKGPRRSCVRGTLNGLPGLVASHRVRDRGGGNDLGVSAARDAARARYGDARSEEHTSELQSRENLVCRLLLEQKKTMTTF